MRAPHFQHNKMGSRNKAASLAAHRDAGAFLRAWSWPSSRLDFITLLLALSVGAWFWAPLMHLIALASEQEHFTHLLLVPILTSYLLFSNRATILSSHKTSPFIGLLVIVSGAVCYLLADGVAWRQDRLTADISAFIVMCWGLFLLAFGSESFRDNLFALAILLFMIPLPPVLLDTIIVFLQRSSADTVDVLFSILGIQALRDGFTFELSHFIIFIEEECSGIRSFFALIITSLLASHWFLVSWWTKAALVSVVVPLAILKNAFRIVGLTLLANYVDPAFLLDSALHRYGGIPLFALSCTMLVCIAWLLYKLERRFKSASHDAFRAQA